MRPIKTVIPNANLLPAVHGLRGLAAMSVLLFHLHHLTNLALPPEIAFVGSHFGLGVHLFFVLSAFSLCYSTTPHIGKQWWLRDYFLKRFFRIAPLFYVMLIVWGVFFRLRGVRITGEDVLLYVTFLFNLVPGKHETYVGAAWTIGVEMIFYVVLPILLLLVDRLSHVVVVWAVSCAVSLIGRGALESLTGLPPGYAHEAFLSSLGVFAAGMLAFWLFKLPKWDSSGTGSGLTNRKESYCLAAMVVALYLLLQIPPLAAFLIGHARADILVWSLLFCVLVVWQARCPSWSLGNRLMEFMGERSYSIYLLHPFLIYWLTPVNRHVYQELDKVIGAWAFLGCGALTLLAVALVSLFTYRFVEVPGIQLGNRLISRMRQSPYLAPA